MKKLLRLFVISITVILTACQSGGTSTSAGVSQQLQFIIQPQTTTPTGTTQGIITPAIKVAILNLDNTINDTATNPVTLSIGNNPGLSLQLESAQSIPSGGIPFNGVAMFAGLLGGQVTVNAVHGIATFDNISISQAGNGYTLVASTPGIISASSTPFNIITSESGFARTSTNGEGSEVVNLTEIGANYQGYCYVYIAYEPNPISAESFATWSQPGWIRNTPRYATFDFSNTLGSPNNAAGPLTIYTDTYSYTWGYIVQTQNYDWPFNPNNYPAPQPTSGWEAGQTQTTVPPGVVKYSNINKNQLYLFTKNDPSTGLPVKRYFVTDIWGNVFTLKSVNRDNTTPEQVEKAFESAVLPTGWVKSSGYLPQDFYWFPIYGNSLNAEYNDFRDSADNAYTQIIWGKNGNSVAQQIGYPMPIYAGSAGARVNGNTTGNSYMYGSDGNDQFYPESGGNYINGGAGYNGVVYPGKINQYTISITNASVHIVGLGNTNDWLTNIQYIQFSDESRAL